MTMPQLTRRIAAGALLLSAFQIGSGRGVGAQSRDGGASEALRLAGRFQVPESSTRAKSATLARSTRIDPALLDLADEFQSGGARGLRTKAATIGASVVDRRVRVEVTAESQGDVDALIDEIERNGGEVTFEFDNAVFADLPADRIEALGRVDELHYLTTPARFKPARQRLEATASRPTSEGAAASRVAALHRAGITGRGVKVGVIDFGFARLRDAISAGRLPQPKDTKGFGGDFNGRQVSDVHGTACAEIVHEMAPDAELYLAMVGTGVDGEGATTDQILQAAAWMAEKDVDIISFSGGGWEGPHDGTDTHSQFIDRLTRERGILWVNAAGNEADEHWGGALVDRDQDGFVDFGGGNGLEIVAAESGLGINVIWDDWGADPGKPAATQDVDAYVVAPKQLEIVGQSINPQQGVGKPKESVVARTVPGQTYVLKLHMKSVSRPGRVHVYVAPARSMNPRSPEGSIGLPAVAKSALAVGAVDVRAGSLQGFSGQGPTDDNRLKPEVVAPDMVPSLAYRNHPDLPADLAKDGRWAGTSAACPHVSGFAALIKQASSRLNGTQLRDTVIRAVRGVGSPVPNNAYGHGHIDGSTIRVGFTGVTLPGAPSTGGGVSAAGIGLELPDELGGAVSTRTLERLWEMAVDRGEDPDVRVVVGQPQYRVGDGMRIGFRSEADCYYGLIHRSAQGQFTVIAPVGGESPRLRGGERYALPAGDRETITVTEPIGREGLLLVCAPEPLDLTDAISGNTRRQNLRLSVVEYSVVR